MKGTDCVQSTDLLREWAVLVCFPHCVMYARPAHTIAIAAVTAVPIFAMEWNNRAPPLTLPLMSVVFGFSFCFLSLSGHARALANGILSLTTMLFSTAYVIANTWNQEDPTPISSTLSLPPLQSNILEVDYVMEPQGPLDILQLCVYVYALGYLVLHWHEQQSGAMAGSHAATGPFVQPPGIQKMWFPVVSHFLILLVALTLCILHLSLSAGVAQL